MKSDDRKLTRTTAADAGPPSRRRWIASVIAGVGLLLAAALVGGGVLRSGRADAPQPAARAIVGSIEVGSRQLSLRDYLAGRGVAPGPYSVQQLGQFGRRVSFEIETHGLAGQRCSLFWSLADQATDQPAPETFWRTSRVEAWPDGIFFPDRADDRLRGEIWVPLPTSGGPFKLTLELFDADGDPLGRSFEPFDLIQSTRPAATPRPLPQRPVVR
jgi:hypothetical protein